ncbi:hypothetical protein [Pseudomonas sp. TH03]|nr:hypothetical protein [Pseudomonas sp. TH03]
MTGRELHIAANGGEPIQEQTRYTGHNDPVDEVVVRLGSYLKQ